MTNTGKFYTNYRFEYPNKNVVVATSSFQDVPSNKKPLINLTMNGILRPFQEKIYEIKLVFEGDDIPRIDICARSYGTFVLCKGVYNAARIVKTLWNNEENTLEVTIDLTKQKVRPRRPVQFSFSIQINDCDVGECYSEQPPTLKTCTNSKQCPGCCYCSFFENPRKCKSLPPSFID